MIDKEKNIYFNGTAWVKIGFHTDSHGVILIDEYDGQWKNDETDTYYY